MSVQPALITVVLHVHFRGGCNACSAILPQGGQTKAAVGIQQLPRQQITTGCHLSSAAGLEVLPKQLEVNISYQAMAAE